MWMCLTNNLKAGMSGLLVSLLCPKPFDGSSYCSACKSKFLENLPLPLLLCSHLPLVPSIPTTLTLLFLEQTRHALSSSVLSAQKNFLQDVWISSWFTHSTLSIFAQMFLNKALHNMTMFFKVACPHSSNREIPFCFIAFLSAFHLLSFVYSLSDSLY